MALELIKRCAPERSDRALRAVVGAILSACLMPHRGAEDQFVMDFVTERDLAGDTIVIGRVRSAQPGPSRASQYLCTHTSTLKILSNSACPAPPFPRRPRRLVSRTTPREWLVCQTGLDPDFDVPQQKATGRHGIRPLHCLGTDLRRRVRDGSETI